MSVLYTCKCGELRITDMGTHIATRKAIDCHISRSYINGVCIKCQTPFKVYWAEWMSTTVKAQEPVVPTGHESSYAERFSIKG